MKQKNILAVDPTGSLTELFQGLASRGVSVSMATAPEEALAWLTANPCRAVFWVLEAPLAQAPLLQPLLDNGAGPPVVVLAGRPSVSEAVSLVRQGVAEYLEPPFSGQQLAQVLSRLPGQEKVRQAKPGKGLAAIIGESREMEKVFQLIRKVGDADTTVLIRGESGTGKELIAQALHQEGGRRHGPFVAVNCGAIPGELLESELFGHEKGAFTHAIRTRMGRFELAHGGTVFLDEISEMSAMLQVKLLRVLQERRFERIGGTKTIHSDFRVVAATNRDLEEEVRQGRFREDLYYRLNVIPIDAPPLRKRSSDIPLLLEHFIARFNRSKRKKISGISPEALRYLLRYPWPGNVRELENMVERMVILASGSVLGLDDLPERLREGCRNLGRGKRTDQPEEIPAEGFFLQQTVAEFEKQLILQALEQTGWVKNRAAKLLNVNRTTLLEKMKRFKLVKAPSTS